MDIPISGTLAIVSNPEGTQNAADTTPHQLKTKIGSPSGRVRNARGMRRIHAVRNTMVLLYLTSATYASRSQRN